VCVFVYLTAASLIVIGLVIHFFVLFGSRLDVNSSAVDCLEDLSQNDPLCVKWNVKLYSLTQCFDTVGCQQGIKPVKNPAPAVQKDCICSPLGNRA